MAYLRETYCFDPVSDNWVACADGPVGRAWHGMAAVNGRAYVIGGSNDETGYRQDVLKVRRTLSLVTTSCFQWTRPRSIPNYFRIGLWEFVTVNVC